MLYRPAPQPSTAELQRSTAPLPLKPGATSLWHTLGLPVPRRVPERQVVQIHIFAGYYQNMNSNRAFAQRKFDAVLFIVNV